MKKGLRFAIIMAAGAVFLLFTAGCASSKKGCHCPSWGKEMHKDSALQKSS